MSGNNDNGNQVRCVIAAITSAQVLIPNALMAEVISYTQPQPFKGGPEWLLGSIDWQGWQVPLLSYSQLLGLCDEEPVESAHIMLLKSLLENRRMPYMGLLLQGAPKLTEVSAGSISESPRSDISRLGLFSQINFNDEEVLIPDMDRLAQLVIHAAYGALPIAGF